MPSTQPKTISTPSARRSRPWLLLVLVLAFAFRLAAAFYWQARFADEGFHFGDSESYWVLAQSIARGGPYEFGRGGARVFRTPGYPLLLAPWFLAFGDHPPVMLARVQSVAFGTVAVLGVWLLARQLFGRLAAHLAALAAAVYPGLIALSVPILSETAFCALLPFQLLLWVLAWQSDTPRRRLLLGFLTGLLGAAITLIRPSWLLFIPFALLACLALEGRKGRQLPLALAILAGLVAGMCPWWIRNFGVTGHFVPTTLQVGASLYDGWNPHATGASDMSYVAAFEQAERRAEAEGLADTRDTFEYRLDRRMHDAAVRWARQHPLDVLRLAAVKFVRIWNLWPNEPTFSRPAVRLAVVVTYLPLLVLGLIGARRAVRRGWPYILCFLPAVYLTLLHMVFIGSIRYREPAMLGIIVLAAGVIASRAKEPRTQ
ncbi:MAG: glycosyltransferase family 39 protein [Thermoguttaceae bacterium]